MNPRSTRHNGATDDSSEYYLETCSLASSISTNATADDLPGLGRTLGLFYSFAGKHLELFLGRLAEKLGKGPRMTAIRIERRRSKAVSLPISCRKAAVQNSKIENDCRRLIRYVRSNVASTKLQAIDQITRLAIEDEFIRDILIVKGAAHSIEPLQRWDSTWVDCFPSLMTSSRRALFSLADTEVNVVGHEIAASLQYSGFNGHLQPLSSIKTYFGDPDRAFLVLRHLERLFDRMHSRCNGCAAELLDFMANLDEFSPNHFEWHTLNGLVAQYTRSIFKPEDILEFFPPTSVLVPMMEMLLRFPEKLPRTINSNFFSWFASFDNTEYSVDIRHAQLTYCLLRGIALANDLDNEASFQNDLGLLQGLYPHPTVQPLLHRPTCPPEILLGQIVAIRHKFKETSYWNESAILIVVESEELEDLCTQLSQYVDSEDELICHRALHAFKYLLSTDIYCRRASFHALSATRFAQTSNFWLLVEESEKKCIPVADGFVTYTFIRGCNSNGDLLYIHDCGVTRCDEHEVTKQVLKFAKESVLEVHIPRGTTFAAAVHHPLVAGTITTGEKAYIAQPVSKSGDRGKHIVITETTKPEELRMWTYDPHFKRRKVVPLYLIVYILRYTPDAYRRCKHFETQAFKDEAGFDATDPFSWKPWTPPAHLHMDSGLTDWNEVETAGYAERNGTACTPSEDENTFVMEEDSDSIDRGGMGDC